MGAVTPGETLSTLYNIHVGSNKTKQRARRSPGLSSGGERRMGAVTPEETLGTLSTSSSRRPAPPTARVVFPQKNNIIVLENIFLRDLPGEA